MKSINNTIIQSNLKDIQINHTIKIKDISLDDMLDLSSALSEWQKNNLFMRFLKELPKTQSDNLEILLDKFKEKNSVIKLIKRESQVLVDGVESENIEFMLWNELDTIIWALIFHSFEESDGSLEVSLRINPKFSGMWLCTKAISSSIQQVLSNSSVKKIVWRHSAMNKWSFWVFRKSWFKLSNFVENWTFLPNISSLTDDFKWELSNTLLWTIGLISNEVDNQKKLEIENWLRKHLIIN